MKLSTIVIGGTKGVGSHQKASNKKAPKKCLDQALDGGVRIFRYGKKGEGCMLFNPGTEEQRGFDRIVSREE